MKIFSVRNMIGLAAIGLGYAYVRKQGGFKAAFNKIASKKDVIIDAIPDSIAGLRKNARDVVEKTL
jgi:hypothetical protein